jgi:hypothetical protein
MATRRGPDESVRVAVSGDNGAATKWTNVFWLHTTHTTPIDAATMNTLCGNIFDLVKVNYVAEMCNQAHILEVQATYFPTGSPLVVAGTHTGSTAGGVTADPAPASLAACISWQSGVYWRGGKPRTYVGGLPVNAMNDERELSTGLVTNLLAEGTGLISGFNALLSGNFDSCQFGFVSFVSGGVDRTPPLFFPIVGCAVHPRADTQRRRLGKS